MRSGRGARSQPSHYMTTGQVTRGGATPRRFAALGNAHQDGVRVHPHTAIS
ncbi:MAG: hypothetical protein WBD47_21880 [Phormidesmis sp.]